MRPTWGHRLQGYQAYEEAPYCGGNPHPDDCLAHYEWALGYLEAMADDGDTREADPIKGKIGEIKHSIKRLLPPVEKVANTIGIRTNEWAGNCYSICNALLNSGLLDRVQDKHGKLILTYGLYWGEFSADSKFSGRPFTHHAWLESPNGHIIDPTHFAFQNTRPEIWVGNIENHDLSGSRMRNLQNPTPPQASGKIIRFSTNAGPLMNVIQRFITGTSNDQSTGAIDIAHLRWLCNLPLEDFGKDPEPFYKQISDMGFGALIPIDNTRWIAGCKSIETGIECQSPRSP